MYFYNVHVIISKTCNQVRIGYNAMKIKSIFPQFGMEGGLLTVECEGVVLDDRGRKIPQICFGKAPAHLASFSATRMVARIPPGVSEDRVYVSVGEKISPPFSYAVAKPWATGLHPVANPAVAPDGTVYTTLSGARGQRIEFSLFKIESDGDKQPLPADIMNPTGLAFDHRGVLYISSRHNGSVYRLTSDDVLERFLGDLGIATGIAFDGEDNLYVGDRNGIIYRVSPARDVDEFAKLEPSVSAYHLAFGPDGDLYVAGPTISTRDPIYRIDPSGEVSTFFQGLGRPQGLMFDHRGALYVGASYKGKKGVFRITEDGSITHILAGPVPVGMALTAEGDLLIADHESLHSVSTPLRGLLLSPY